jgi:hypothetical protein
MPRPEEFIFRLLGHYRIYLTVYNSVIGLEFTLLDTYSPAQDGSNFHLVSVRVWFNRFDFLYCC